MKSSISIIIPVYNQAKELEFLLHSLFTQTFKEILEIIICDDGSDDNIKSVIDSSPLKNKLKYFRQEHKGFRAGKVRNLGIFNAKGDILIFIDGDMILDNNFINTHYKIHKKNRENILVIGCRYTYNNVDLKKEFLYRDINTFINMLRNNIIEIDPRIKILKNYLKNINKFPYPFLMVWSCNLSIKRKLMIETGGFDEFYIGYGAEDTDLGYRLQNKGVKFIFEPKAICYHKYHSRTPEHYISVVENGLKLYKKYNMSSYIAEGLILSCNDLVYNEYKKALNSIIGSLERDGKNSIEEVDKIIWQ